MTLEEKARKWCENAKDYFTIEKEELISQLVDFAEQQLSDKDKEIEEHLKIIHEQNIEYIDLFQEKEQLKAQIEKMKCCGNCNHKTEKIDTGAYLVPCQYYNNCKVCEKWEKEN